MSNTTIQACLAHGPSLLLKNFLAQSAIAPPQPLPDSEHLYEADHIYVNCLGNPWLPEERRALGEMLSLPAHHVLVMDTLVNTLKDELLQDVLMNLIARSVILQKQQPSIFVLSPRSDLLPFSNKATPGREVLIDDFSEGALQEKLQLELNASIASMQEGLRLVRAIFNIHEELNEEYARHGGLKNRLYELEQSLLISEEKLKQAQARVAEMVTPVTSFLTKIFSRKFKKSLQENTLFLENIENDYKGFLRAKTRVHEDWLRLSGAIEQFSLWLEHHGIGPVSFFDVLDWNATANTILPNLLAMIDRTFRKEQADLFLKLYQQRAFPLACEITHSVETLLKALSSLPDSADWVFVEGITLSSIEYAAILNRTKRLIVLNDLTTKSRVSVQPLPKFYEPEIDVLVNEHTLPELPIERLKSFATTLPTLPIRKGKEHFNELAMSILKSKPENKMQLPENSILFVVETDEVARVNALKFFLKQPGSKLIVADTVDYAKTLSGLFKRRKQVMVAALQDLPYEHFDSIVLTTELDEHTKRPYEFDKHKEAVARLLMLTQSQFILLGRFDLVHPYETTAVAHILRHATPMSQLEFEPIELE